MDWRIYHAINTFVANHSWIGRAFHAIETYGTILIALAAFALWLFARPGGDRKWKFAAASALGAAALGLIVNRIIASAWHRDRPFITHPSAHVWGPHKTDPSFPSDHSTAAVAIAVAVLLIDVPVGLLFLALAVLIAVGRVVIGEHYPGDVLASALIATAAALLIVRVGRPLIAWLIRVVEHATDPVVGFVWRKRVRAS